MNTKLRHGFEAIIIGGLFTLICLCSIMGEQKTALGREKVEYFNENWTYVSGDGVEGEIVTLPIWKESSSDSVEKIINTIPKSFAGKVMVFESEDCFVKVMIDDECIYDFGLPESYSAGRSPGSLYHVVEIPEKIDQGVICIEKSSPYNNFAAHFFEIKVVSMEDASMNILLQNIPRVAISIMIIIFSVMMALMYVISNLTLGQDALSSTKGLLYLSAYEFTAGIYYGVETNLFSSYGTKPQFHSMLSYILFLVMPLALLLYYRANALMEYSNWLTPLIITFMINAVVQLILDIFRVFDFSEMVFVTQILSLFSITLGIICLWRQAALERTKFNLFHAIVFSLLAVSNVLDILLVFRVKFGDAGYVSRVPCLMYCIAMAILFFTQIYNNNSMRLELQAAILQKEVEDEAVKNAELIKAKEEAEKAKLDALIANAAKSSFLAKISHEIRTPINTILGMDTMILREAIDHNIKGYARDIQNAGKLLLALINDILDFSKIESGKMEIIEDKYDTYEMISDVINMIHFRAEAKKLEVNLDIDPDIPGKLYGDDVRIKQIMVNILTNAVKYTEKGGIYFKIYGAMKENNQYLLRVEVKDTGIGIKEEDIPKLFEAFQRIEENRNRSIEGTGLGMSICVQLLKMMGSKLEVESEYGKGSTFSFQILQKVEDVMPIGDYSKRSVSMEETYQQQVYAPDAKVLVVDDNPLNLKVFSNLLKQTGIQISEAESGFACLEFVKRQRFDMIFMDHMMPEMDGMQTLEQIKSIDNLCKEVPIIALTANAVNGAKEMYLESGFADFLSKPVNPDALEKMLATHLPKELMKDPPEDMVVPKKKEEHIKMPDIEGVDWDIARLHLPSDELLMSTLHNIFQTLLYEVESLEKYLTHFGDDGAVKNYEIKVHALKSTLNLIGAAGLSGIAKILERSAKEEELERIRKLSPILMEECRVLHKNMEILFPVEQNTISDTEMIEILEDLSYKTETLDVDGMDEVLKFLEGCEIREEAQAIYRQLQASVVNLDMEDVILQTKNMKKIYSN